MIKISNKKVVLVQNSVLGYPLGTSEQSLMENSSKTSNDLQSWLCSPIKPGNAEVCCGVEFLVDASSRMLLPTGAAALLKALCVQEHPCGFPGSCTRACEEPRREGRSGEKLCYNGVLQMSEGKERTCGCFRCCWQKCALFISETDQ